MAAPGCLQLPLRVYAAHHPKNGISPNNIETGRPTCAAGGLFPYLRAQLALSLKARQRHRLPGPDGQQLCHHPSDPAGSGHRVWLKGGDSDFAGEKKRATCNPEEPEKLEAAEGGTLTFKNASKHEPGCLREGATASKEPFQVVSCH